MPSTTYAGTELDVFVHARNWKRYLRDTLAPDLRGRVLEVGGGIGGTTAVFRDARQTSWTVLEPDVRLAAQLVDRARTMAAPVHVVAGLMDAVLAAPRFDCILYIDVLEHIERDADELREAARRLAPGGVIVVMSPAHQWLFTPFDEAIGHCRRYDRASLARLTPDGTRLVRLTYLDAFGLCLSLGNKLLLRSASPTLAQVKLWDTWCIPASRRLDALTGGRLGKSILAVWRKAP